VIEAGGTDANGNGMHDGAQGELTTPPDSDGDGQPDYVDLDSDNDSVSDLVEGGSGATDANNDGVADGPDADGDGIVDSADDNDAQFGETADPGAQNSDGADNPDYLDPDSDNDGTPDIDENGNGDLDANNDGVIDNPADADGDGIPDNVDDDDANFGGLAALDTDGDGIPDAQDLDDDNDGIPDSVEIANAPANGDTDGDGIPDHLDLDSDNDGINDVIEAGGTDANGNGMHDGAQGELTTPPDSDGDGQPDYVDLDSDNDSVSDLVEGGSGATDANNDGVADGPDADGDGIVDSADDNDAQFGETADPGAQNSDGADNPDYLDPDSDNDGTPDIDENGNGDLDANNDGVIDNPADADGDGIPDNVDDDDANFGGLASDTTAPAPPTVTEPVSGTVTSDTTPVFAGTGEPGADVTVRDAEGDIVCTATVAPDGSWTCTPTTPLNEGEQTFAATQTDASGNESDPTPVTITVDISINNAPVATSDTYTVPESVPAQPYSVLDVLANDSDPDSDVLTITQVSAPAHGVAATDGATIVYTPTAGYLGSDVFTYTISDGELEDSAQVTLTISPVADLSVEQTREAIMGGLKFTIVARNLGPRPANGAVISDVIPSVLTNINWTCEGADGATCPNASGTGDIHDTLSTFPSGGVVTYTITTLIGEGGIAFNTVSIMPPVGVMDVVMSNNTASVPTIYLVELSVIFRHYTP